jgi:MarR family transcriptional regulator, organic hydroperoxide resistance regulator
LPVLADPDELELRTWVQMMRTFTRMTRHLEQALEGHGLSLPQFDILATLGRDEGITQQELAQRLLVTKGNVCGMIDRMEAGGWVQRRPDPDDRRANRLLLTRRGRALLARVMPEQMALVKQVMGALCPAELQALHQSLDRLEESIDG